MRISRLNHREMLNIQNKRIWKLAPKENAKHIKLTLLFKMHEINNIQIAWIHHIFESSVKNKIIIQKIVIVAKLINWCANGICFRSFALSLSTGLMMSKSRLKHRCNRAHLKRFYSLLNIAFIEITIPLIVVVFKWISAYAL